MEQETNERVFDLGERTSVFEEKIIDFCKLLRLNTITRPIIDQLIRSSTSIGANYQEACGGSSQKDFRNKIFICKKEAQETKYWLRMLLRCFPEKRKEIHVYHDECHALNLIFQIITSTLDKKA